MKISVTINNKPVELDVMPDEYLAESLRRYGYLSIRKGCDTGSCGLCTVWLDDKPILSCSVLSMRTMGKRITTTEGVQEEAQECAQYIVDEGAEQCGFCSPGLIMTILAMKRELVNPTEQDIVHYLNGNLCRCTGYVGQLRAVKKYLGVE